MGVGKKWAQAVVHIDFTDYFMVKFVPDLDSNVNMNHQEPREAPLISHQMLLCSVHWGLAAIG